MIFRSVNVGVFNKIKADIINLKPAPMYEAVSHLRITGSVCVSDVLNRIDYKAFSQKNNETKD